MLVDAAEGPMPQTKFVVSQGAQDRAASRSSSINKIDRPDARPIEVVNEVFDLFAALDATDEQLDFPILYGSAKRRLDGDERPRVRRTTAWRRCSTSCSTMSPPPTVEDGPFRMLGTILEANPFLGRILTGRITSRHASSRTRPIKALDRDGKLVEQGRVSKVLAFRGLERVAVDEAEAGDIVAIAGLHQGDRRRHHLRRRR